MVKSMPILFKWGDKIRSLSLRGGVQRRRGNLFGFTLAEVLITLSIIGVVAALTISPLVKSYQEAQFKTAAKKIYSDLTQATQLLLIDNNFNFTNVFYSASNSNVVLRTKYLEKMKYVKTSNSRSDCWFPLEDGGPPYYYNYPSSTANGYGYGICAILPSGAFINFYVNDSACPYNATAGQSQCGRIDFDVNGAKGPNTFGKDIFEAKVLREGISPAGVGGGTFNDCDAIGYGWGCLAKVLANEDY